MPTPGSRPSDFARGHSGCANCERLTRELREAREELAIWSGVDEDTEGLEWEKVGAYRKAFGMTSQEARVFDLLMDKPGLASVERIRFHASKGEATEPQIVNVLICKLRRKLKYSGMGDVIKTRWGSGYEIEREDKERVIECISRQ
jgi:DNA-binding response OmpR family regulator